MDLKAEMERRRELRKKGVKVVQPPVLPESLAQNEDLVVLMSFAGPKGFHVTSEQMIGIILAVGGERQIMGTKEKDYKDGLVAQIYAKGGPNGECWPADLVAFPLNKWFTIPPQCTTAAKVVKFAHDDVQQIWQGAVEAHELFDAMVDRAARDAAEENKKILG